MRDSKHIPMPRLQIEDDDTVRPAPGRPDENQRRQTTLIYERGPGVRLSSDRLLGRGSQCSTFELACTFCNRSLRRGLNAISWEGQRPDALPARVKLPKNEQVSVFHARDSALPLTKRDSQIIPGANSKALVAAAQTGAGTRPELRAIDIM